MAQRWRRRSPLVNRDGNGREEREKDRRAQHKCIERRSRFEFEFLLRGRLIKLSGLIGNILPWVPITPTQFFIAVAIISVDVVIQVRERRWKGKRKRRGIDREAALTHFGLTLQLQILGTRLTITSSLQFAEIFLIGSCRKNFLMI